MQRFISDFGHWKSIRQKLYYIILIWKNQKQRSFLIVSNILFCTWNNETGELDSMCLYVHRECPTTFCTRQLRTSPRRQYWQRLRQRLGQTTGISTEYSSTLLQLCNRSEYVYNNALSGVSCAEAMASCAVEIYYYFLKSFLIDAHTCIDI